MPRVIVTRIKDMSIAGKKFDPEGMFRFPQYAEQIARLTKSIESKINIKAEPKGFSIGFANFQWYVHDTTNARLYKEAPKKHGRQEIPYADVIKRMTNPKKTRVKIKKVDNIGITPIEEGKENVPCEKLDEALFFSIAKWNIENPNDKILLEGSLAKLAAAFIPELDINVKTNSFSNHGHNEGRELTEIPLREISTRRNPMSRLFSKVSSKLPATGRGRRSSSSSSDSSIDTIQTGGDSPKITPTSLRRM
jgi:hypothetical protein